MRYLLSTIACLASIVVLAQDQKSSSPSSWNDFVAGTVRSLQTDGSRVVLSEDLRLSSEYRHRTFDAEATKSGYYIVILYMSKFCKAPAAYFNYGENTGGDYSFHGGDDGTYAYQLLKVKSYPGKTGHIYVKYGHNPEESRSMRLLVIDF